MARLRKHRSSAPRPLSPRGPPIVRCDTDPSQTTELLQGQELPRKLHLFLLRKLFALCSRVCLVLRAWWPSRTAWREARPSACVNSDCRSLPERPRRHQAMEALLGYLVSELTPARIERLYDEQPYTCLAVFRSLPDLEKQYVYRLLYCSGHARVEPGGEQGGSNPQVDADEGSTPIEIVSSFIQEKHAARHRGVLSILSRLRIVLRGAGVFTMHPGFRRHVQRALSSGVRGMMCGEYGGLLDRGEADGRTLGSLPTQAVVDAYAWEQWERVLMFTIGEGTSESGKAPQPRLGPSGGSKLDLRGIMLAAGVLREDVEKKETNITERGFQFLLSDTHAQVWIVLKEYIKQADARSHDVFDALIEFMLRLGFQRRNASGIEVQKSAQGKEICADLCALGLLYPVSPSRMVPTKLAVMISASTASSLVSTLEEDGFVIVETNYRVYAYTSSPLKQAILRLFVRTEVLLANLLVGSITRESVMSALDSGITSEQILGYLTQHAHKRVLGRSPIVPTVVMDSIRLWQQELRRMEMEHAILYKNFETPALYKQVREYAVGIGADLAIDDAKQELVARAEQHDLIKSKIKELKERP